MARKPKSPSSSTIKAKADRAEAASRGDEEAVEALREATPLEPKVRADFATRFKPGNRFWEARSSHGRNPKFETAEKLQSACYEYFAWVEENPLLEAKAFSSNGKVIVEKLPKMRAMSLGGLCGFIGISLQCWLNWRKERPDFVNVIADVEGCIRRQKFEGASADLLNANIISRDLGMADRQELTGKDGAPIEVGGGLGDIESARFVAFMLGRAVERQTHETKEPAQSE